MVTYAKRSKALVEKIRPRDDSKLGTFQSQINISFSITREL